MAIIESLILSSCVSLTGDAQTACQKALEAASKQSGIEVMANTTEEKYTKKADDEAHILLGDTKFNVVAATVYAAKVASDKAVSFGLPTFGLCNNVNAQVGQDKSALKMEWKF